MWYVIIGGIILWVILIGYNNSRGLMIGLQSIQIEQYGFILKFLPSLKKAINTQNWSDVPDGEFFKASVFDTDLFKSILQKASTKAARLLKDMVFKIGEEGHVGNVHAALYYSVLKPFHEIISDENGGIKEGDQTTELLAYLQVNEEKIVNSITENLLRNPRESKITEPVPKYRMDLGFKP
jgi:hypothetical protein